MFFHVAHVSVRSQASTALYACFHSISQPVSLRNAKVGLAFNLFHAFVLLNGKLYRQGKITLQELRLQLDRAVEHGLLLPLFSG
jgi:hypothetical protein